MNHRVKRRRQALHQTHHRYYLNIIVEAANLSDWRIESKKIDLVARIESNRNFFCPNWNALLSTLSPYISVHRKIEQIRIRQVCVDPCPSDRSVRRWLLLLSGAGICQLIARKRRGTDGHQPDA